MLLLKKIFNKFIALVFIYFFSYCVWIFSKPYVLTPLDLENVIELKVGYVNTQHETFDVYYSNEDNPSISSAFGDIGDLRKITFFIPFVNARNIKFVFGKEGNVARIDRMAINGYEIPLDELFRSLYKQNFQVGKSKNGESIYIVSKGKNYPYMFEFDDKLEYISENELASIEETDITISYYLFLGYFLIFLLIYVLFSHYIKDKIWKNSIGFFTSLILLITLIHSFCYIVGYKFITGIQEAPDHFLNFLKYESNLLPLILFGMLPLVYATMVKNITIKVALQILSLSFIVVLGIDNFVTQTFLTRFVFIGATGFVVDLKSAIPFFLSYIDTTNGFLAIVAFIVCVICIFKYLRATVKKIIAVSYSVICIASLIFAFWPFEKTDLDIYFANVFQVNHITTNNMGNYYREFSDEYPYRKNLNFDWKEGKGLGQRKSVIIILAESLSCDLTKMCGTGTEKELTPNLSAIAKDSYFFNNYYSDSYSTSMAALTIIKAFPAFPQRTPSSYVANKFTKELSNQNDLISAFSNNGYKTSFFSSTDMVFSMDQVMDQTHFDQIFDSNSEIFDKNDRKYIFNSVSDEVLFNSILKYISTQPKDQKLFIMTKTAGSHVPFDSPWGAGNFDNAFLYSDYAINGFIEALKRINYFENGIVVITGDHQPWGYESSKTNRGLFDKNHVPLIIIDKDKKQEVNNTMFSHSSLGIYLQSLMLDSYKYNRFNADPIHSSEPPLLLAYELDKQIFALVKKGDKETRIKFDGDDTEFVEKIFDDDYEHDVLGYLATCGL